MQALILAAGRGSRLHRYTRNAPKCFLPIQYGQMVIERALDQLKARGVDHVTVVLGYQRENGERLLADLQREHADLKIDIAVNADFQTTGTLRSFLIGYEALPRPEEEFFLIEGDVVFDSQVLALLAEEAGCRLAVDLGGDFDAEGMKCRLRGNLVCALSKQMPVEEADGEFTGLALLEGEQVRQWIPLTVAFDEADPLAYYDDFFNHLLVTDAGARFEAVDIGSARWTEIDFPEDYKRARAIFAGDQPLEVPSHLFEGTEHSPSVLALAPGTDIEIRDFCFLANPYLMAEPMVRERLQWEIPSLMVAYPPEQSSLRQLVAALHDDEIPESHILVTNGAAEAIALLPHLCRHLLTPIPTFSEYLHVTEKSTVFPLPAERDFDLEPDEVIAAARANDVDGVVLINPNNPVGRLLSRDEVLAVADALPDCRIIVDESFLPFCGQSESALPALPQHDNIVVIYSYGKTMGIPGLRVGAMFAPPKMIDVVDRWLPVWNVNSIATFFLRLMSEPEYAELYRQSLVRVSETTQRLYQGLKTLDSHLHAFPPTANFVFARLHPPRTSTELRDRLLRDRIYIRDCRNKAGLDESYIRVAARTDRENADFVRHLTSLLADWEHESDSPAND